MKKVLILISIASLTLLTSCLGSDDTDENTTDTENKTVDQAENNSTNGVESENTEEETMDETSSGSSLDNLETNQEDMVKNEGPVKAGDNVEVHYKGTLEDGTQFDSSYDRGQTLPFTVGAGQMIAGFDKAVVGMKVGEKKTITLKPEEAYGEYDETKKQVVPKADLASFTAAGYELKVGEKLPTQVGELEIIAVDDETVTLDVNHPLAGKTLIFDIELVEIK